MISHVLLWEGNTPESHDIHLCGLNSSFTEETLSCSLMAMVVTWWPVLWWDFSEWRVLWCSSNGLYYNTKKQSIISQSSTDFFYYHLVSYKEKTSLKTTSTNNAIQNGTLMWESRVLAVFEEWDLFQVLFYFYFFWIYFLMNSRDIQYQNRGFWVSSSGALVQIYSHWLPESL